MKSFGLRPGPWQLPSRIDDSQAFPHLAWQAETCLNEAKDSSKQGWLTLTAYVSRDPFYLQFSLIPSNIVLNIS